MPQSDPHLAVKPLIDLLEQEHDALLKGRLQDLESIFEKKSELFGRLETQAPGKSLLSLLIEQSNRNQLLYAAALDGLKSAKERVETVRASVNGFSVYDNTGASQTLQRNRRRHSRKA